MAPVVKNLGVTFDQHLSWIPHVAAVVQKTIGTLMGLSHKRHLSNDVIETLVIPHGQYCLTVIYPISGRRGIHFHLTSAVPSPCQPGRLLLKYTSTP